MVQIRNVHVDKTTNASSNWELVIPGLADHGELIELETLLSEKTSDDVQVINKAREMVEILLSLNLDKTGLFAALLLPYFEANIVDETWIAEHTDEQIAQLVVTVEQMKSISELQHFRRGRPSEAQIDTVRRMLLAMVEDVRAVLIKLAERICYLRIVKNGDEEERVLTAKECNEIFAPLANRLGIGQLKWEIEDLAFRYLNPDIYKNIAKELDERRIQREQYIRDFVQTLDKLLKEHEIQAEVYGRPKHIYSIWRKMQNKHLRFEELYDIRAVRVIAKTLKDCYGALGIVHSQWRHIASEFDDYIATPKANGYQSIHTVVIGPESKNIEIQVRTEQMHNDAELGVAAHWMYKEGATSNSKTQSYEGKIAWLRQLLTWHEDMAENEELVQEIRSQVFDERVYVFTPQGDVIDLPKGATPLDFAYYIHSQIGHRCIGAKVDGRIVPFNYQLNNAERVEILTQKEPNPKRDWMNPQLGYLNTSRARSKVISYYKKYDRDDHLALGRSLFEDEVPLKDFTTQDLQQAAQKFNMQSFDDLLVAIGAGDIRLVPVINFLNKETKTSQEEAQEHLEKLTKKAKPIPQQEKQRGATGAARVAGIGNLMMSFAKCCQPLPGDPIIGYITKGRGVSVHHLDCEQLQTLLLEEPRRAIDVEWEMDSKTGFEAKLMITAINKSSMLHTITSLLTHEKVMVRNISSHFDKDGQVIYLLTILIYHHDDIHYLTQKLEQVIDILEVKRAL